MAIEVDVQRRLGDLQLEAAFSGQPGVTALFGPSGAGKTSIINMIAGLLRPQRGRIAVDGRVLFDSERAIDVPTRRRRVGYVFQESRLFPHFSVRRNLLYGQRFVAAGERWASFDAIVDMLGIDRLLARRPAMLSGGERQRVAIGRALLASPMLLLMDEPLASLDAARKAEILPYIERLRDELDLPMVYVSHQFEEVKRLANGLVMLADGKVAAAGTLNEVIGRLDMAPLAGRNEAGAVIEAEVVAHDADLRITRLRCGAGDLVVPHVAREIGSRMRVHVRATDVMLALQPPHGLSVQNSFPATIVEVGCSAHAWVAYRLDAGGLPILAHVTRKAARDLDLRVGTKVHALFKSVAVDGCSAGAAPA